MKLSYRLERTHDMGNTVSYLQRDYDTCKPQWSSDRRGAEIMPEQEALDLMQMYTDYAATKGNSNFLYNVVEVESIEDAANIAANLRATAEAQIKIWTERLNRLNALEAENKKEPSQ